MFFLWMNAGQNRTKLKSSFLIVEFILFFKNFIVESITKPPFLLLDLNYLFKLIFEQNRSRDTEGFTSLSKTDMELSSQWRVLLLHSYLLTPLGERWRNLLFFIAFIYFFCFACYQLDRKHIMIMLDCLLGAISGSFQSTLI